MATFRVNNLAFSFRSNIRASKYDDWAHHRAVLMIAGKKAVDLVAIRRTTPSRVCWLIEAKDFRLLSGAPGDKNVFDLPRTVAQKAVDTWTGLEDAASNAANFDERHFADLARSASEVRVVLHMEPYAGGHSKLFPRIPNPANVLQKLKQFIVHLDATPLVLSIATTAQSGVPWSVSGL
jgi:hypothetical protein